MIYLSGVRALYDRMVSQLKKRKTPHLVSLLGRGPVGVVALRRVEVPFLNIDHGSLHRAAELRVFVVEVLQGLAELVAVPEADDDDAVLARQLFHLPRRRKRYSGGGC